MNVDPVTFQVVVSRLSGIVQEMQYGIFRTGYSTIIRESHDASCMILDANGDVVGEHAILPLHVGALPCVVRASVRAFGDEIRPGDVFITNHPYVSGVPHAMDMAVVAPVFHEGAPFAFVASIAHKSDLGGVIPGTGYGQARELFQEGIQYPPVRFIAAGRVVRDVEAILRANTRTPELVLGDLRGQAGVARLGERRIVEMIAKYGADAVRATFARVHDVTERRLRRAIARWPDGEHEAEAFVDSDGIDLERRIRYHVRVTKRGERIHFDYSGSDDQVQGPVNIQPALARACLAYALIGFVDKTIPNNGGVARVVEATFREGSVLNARYPAAHNTYMASTIAVTEAAIDALGGFDPARRQAGNGGVGGNSIAGRRADGTPFVQYELIGSAYGARAWGDGASGVDVLLSNGRTAPIEVLENEYPTRVERFELIRDSGGPGRFRGGLAPRRVYRILTDDAQWTLRGGRHAIPAFGVDGGKPGRLGSATRNPGAPDEERLPSRFSNVRLRAGDVIALEKAGGGGFGDPRERAFAAIVDDVLDGYVSVRAACEEYGVDRKRLAEAVASWDTLAWIERPSGVAPRSAAEPIMDQPDQSAAEQQSPSAAAPEITENAAAQAEAQPAAAEEHKPEPTAEQAAKNAELEARRARAQAAWERVVNARQSGEILSGVVTAAVKGGLLVDVGSIRGFLPASQVRTEKGVAVESLVKTRIPLKVIDVDASRRRIVVSHRRAVEEERRAKRGELLRSLQPGQVREGVVVRLADFGAFVDLGGVDGLIPLRELAFERVEKASDVVKVGERLPVEVLRLEEGGKKITLSRKSALPDPWRDHADVLQRGSMVEGKVVAKEPRLQVELAPGVVGSVRESDANPADYEIGETIEVAVRNVDRRTRRITLSTAHGGATSASSSSGFAPLGVELARREKRR